MFWIKRVLLILFVGVMGFLISLNIFIGLKLKGNSNLFRFTQPYDLVIKHAMILDGTGEKEAFQGDIGIKDGYIVGIGYINPKKSPMFDAGGLTFIPYPVKIEKCNDVLEHVLDDSYPRYPAEEIILQDEPYEGMSLGQASQAKGVTPEDMFNYLNAFTRIDKVLLAPLEYRKDEISTKEMLARLTSYPASLMGVTDHGCIMEGFRADFYIYKTYDYPEEKINEVLRKGTLPTPVYQVEEGKFLNL